MEIFYLHLLHFSTGVTLVRTKLEKLIELQNSTGNKIIRSGFTGKHSQLYFIFTQSVTEFLLFINSHL